MQVTGVAMVGGSWNCAGVTSAWARDYAVQFVVNVLVSNDMYSVFVRPVSPI